ncbi:MAG: hypothetical protein ACUVXA_05740 [Candidatus Jordarchaeum sp.]
MFKAEYVSHIQACIDRICENADEIIQKKFKMKWILNAQTVLIL